VPKTGKERGCEILALFLLLYLGVSLLRFLCLACCVWAPSVVFGQTTQYAFSRLDISNGLSNNQVNCFYKDKTGFLWTGTMSGLNRYDGYQFKVFRHDPRDSNSLIDDFIARILEGPENKLWVETRKGFNLFDPLTEKFSPNYAAALRQMNIAGNQVTDIRKDSRGNYWFLMGRQILYTWNPQTKKTTIAFKSLYQQDQIAFFSMDKQGHCFIIHGNGLITVLNTADGKIISTNDIPSRVFGKTSLLYSGFIDAQDDLWLFIQSGNAGVLRWNFATNAYMLFEKDKGPAPLNSNLVISLQQDNMDNIWICTDHGGINIYNKQNNTIRYILHNDDERKSLSQNSITASYKDNSGIIWLGTYKQGISYYHENIIKFPIYKRQSSDPASLPFDDVNKFVEDGKGNIWIGTNGGGLIYFDRANNKFTRFIHDANNRNSISNDVIVSLCIDHEQKLWIGSYYGGLDCYINGKFTHYKNDPADPNSLSDDRVWEIYEDRRNNLWIGTLNGGLNRFDREKHIFYRMQTGENSIHSNYVCAFAEDAQGSLWIGTGNGIDVLDNQNNITYYSSYAGQISVNNIISLFRDSRGLMWIGTRDGLNVFDPTKKSFQFFRTEQGLPGNTIQNILEDGQGHLWISTNHGLASITVTYDKTNPISIRCVNYDELDGLQGTEFNENAALKTSKGEMIFGGSNGFNLFQPSLIKTERVKSAIVLTDLQLFNKSVVIGEKISGRPILLKSVSETSGIKLRHNENILAIEFAALNFSNPEKIKYAYRLDGFNNDWVYTDGRMRKAIYTNLDPGSYTFRVKASDEDGQWNNNSETTLAISIRPPFWKTPWAFILYALAIALALWLARRIVLERARMRFEVERQRQEAERIQQVDALKTKFFTNVSHEFRTPLSLILSPLDKIVKKAADPEQKKQLQLVQRNAKRLLNLVNQLLDFRKMEVQDFSIHLTRQDIVHFTRDIVYSFSDISEKKDIALTFTSVLDSLETYFDKDKLEKILFNLLSNAFKYTPGGGKVSVELDYLKEEKSNAQIALRVKDTGIGIAPEMHEKIFERFYQLNVPGDIQSSGSGIGLVITREFVKLHGGTIKIESEPEKGTSFTVLLPVKEVHEPISLNGNGAEVVLTGDVPVNLSAVPEEIEYGENGAQNGQTNGQAGESSNRKKSILLVEDNEDFRFYLKDNLKQRYHVTEAVNGKDGWEKVKELQPELVVSDIMMPMMNGIELSKKIRTDPRTSHIPVILLTAMGDEETELEGFRAGINDYISKPFTFEILASRIKSLLNMREQLRKKFQQQVDITPAEVTVTPVDEEFMKRAFEIVEKNMNNPEFSVEDLSRELFMSRVGLYKKIVSITGKTPIEFIRIMRLKRAAQLLQQGQTNIASIAYEVGYNNPKIFSKYFKEEFGVIPSKYQFHSPKH
jgi:signal transduction histidine kinase/ligand-binding sensor domain-containing protein/DNA-binding response OmpR family regulator